MSLSLTTISYSSFNLARLLSLSLMMNCSLLISPFCRNVSLHGLRLIESYEILDFLLHSVDVLFVFLENMRVLFDGFVLFLVLEVLLRKGNFLGVDFFFELRYLVVGNFVPSFDLCDLVLCLRKVLRVEILSASHCFVETLLSLKLRFCFYVLLLELGDQVVLEFDLLESSKILCVRLGCLLTVLLFFLFEITELLFHLIELPTFL